MQTGRGFERLVNFSDAVIAIAMTLLVLPLVEIPAELDDDHSIGTVFADHDAEFLAFVISFLVIWNFWSAHHRTMEYFRGYDDALMGLHMVWLFTMVALPFTTQLLTTEDAFDHGASAIYVAVLLVSSLALLGIELRGRRHRELLHPDRAEVDAWVREPLAAALVTSAILLLTLITDLIWPPVGPWPLLLLLLTGPLSSRLRRRSRSRSAG